MRHVWFGVVLALGLPAASFGADWPHFLGPFSNGISPERGINKSWRQKPPKMLWRVSLSDNGYAGPSVSGGKVFIVDHQGGNDVVRAIDMRTGRDAWRCSYPDTATANYGYARATPTVNSGKVYTLSRLGVLNCLDAGRGKKLWSVDIVRQFGGKRGGWDLAGSPAIDGKKLIVVPGGASATVVALDKNTGKPIWRCAANDAAGYATPVVATLGGKRQYVIFSATKAMGVDAGSGRVLWSIPWRTQYDANAATPVAIGNSVFITSGYGHGGAMVDVSARGARIRWQNRDIQSQFSTPIVARGRIYCTSDTGNLVCMDARTGRALWKQTGFPKGGLVGVDGTLIAVNGRNGEVAMANLGAPGYQELGRFRPLGGESWTAPIVANGCLLLRNHQTLACFSLK